LAVSKRVRYEVLKRDNYTCRYCGAFAPIVILHVDHVVPRKHGGSDKVTNLVTACQDCNSGKSASMPEPGLVAEIEEMARAWAREMHGDPNEDDLLEMHVYQEALYFLETLTPEQVLHFIASAFAAALPYRPTHAELIRAAGCIAKRDLAQVPTAGT
jgi:HNH endonuclease